MKIKYLFVCAFLTFLSTSCTDLKEDQLDGQKIKELRNEKLTGDDDDINIRDHTDEI